MEPLINAIVLWLSLNFALPLATEQPRVAYVSPDRLMVIRNGGLAGQAPDRTVLGAYDSRSRTIHLRDDWDSRSAADVSVLVHELVHYLQDRAVLQFECPAAREASAYAAQERWLQMFGSDLESTFGIDAMTRKLRTSCLPH